MHKLSASLDTFLLFCLFSDSAQTTCAESLALSENMLRTVYQGRDPKLNLYRDSKPAKPSRMGCRTAATNATSR